MKNVNTPTFQISKEVNVFIKGGECVYNSSPVEELFCIFSMVVDTQTHKNDKLYRTICTHLYT